MKLALCLEYPIDQHGGTEVLVRQLITGLSQTHQIILVSGESGDSARESSVKTALSDHIAWNPTGVSSTQARRLAAALRLANVDLAHFHFGGNYAWGNRAFNQCPIVHASRLGVRCVSTNHGAFSIMDGYCGSQRSISFKLALFLPAWLSKQYALAHLKCEVTVSQHDYRAVRRWYPLMRRKFRQIYHSKLRQDSTADAPGERSSIILCVGTVGLRKGQPVLVESFARLASRFPDWQLVLIGRMGDEAMARQIGDLISSHGLEQRVQLLGERTDAEVEGWLKTAAIFAMPSYREGLGLSLQEALFHGCVGVGSRVGGIPELIDHEVSGLLVPPGDIPALTAALDRLMTDRALLEKFRAQGRAAIVRKGMTASAMIDQYQQLYKRCLVAPK